MEKVVDKECIAIPNSVDEADQTDVYQVANLLADGLSTRLVLNLPKYKHPAQASGYMRLNYLCCVRAGIYPPAVCMVCWGVTDIP